MLPELAEAEGGKRGGGEREGAAGGRELEEVAPGVGFGAGEMRPLDGPGGVVGTAVGVGAVSGEPGEGAGGERVGFAGELDPALAGGAEDDERGGGAFGPGDEVVGGAGEDAGVGHEEAAEERVFFGGAADGSGEDDEVLIAEAFGDGGSCGDAGVGGWTRGCGERSRGGGGSASTGAGGRLGGHKIVQVFQDWLHCRAGRSGILSGNFEINPESP